MNTKSLFLLILLCAVVKGLYSGTGIDRSIIIFPGTPNPCDNKCLIRTYFPEKDSLSSIRILSSDSTVVREVSMAGEVGIGSAVVPVSDLKNGTYLYQLFYKGQTQWGPNFVVKH